MLKARDMMLMVNARSAQHVLESLQPDLGYSLHFIFNSSHQFEVLNASFKMV